MNKRKIADEFDIDTFKQRYLQNEKRSEVFCDLIISEAKRVDRQDLTILDVGCGSGFDNKPRHQEQIRDIAKLYLGVEPDTEIDIPAIFDETYRCGFESASIAEESVHIAYAVMVLEHIENPAAFFKKIHAILALGGVFWGFTVDARHPFAWGSVLMESLKLKELYLNLLMGKPGDERFVNYPTSYRANSPRRIRRHTNQFEKSDIWSWSRVGENDYVVPKRIRFVAHAFDRLMLVARLPGSTLLVRLQK